MPASREPQALQGLGLVVFFAAPVRVWTAPLSLTSLFVPPPIMLRVKIKLSVA